MATSVMKAQSAAVQERKLTNLETAVYAKSFRYELSKILGSNPDDLDSFTTEVFNQARKVPDLHHCTIETIRFHLLRVAQLRLNPALPNEVFFIPRNNKQPDGQWAKELSIQYGYGGLRKLVMRSPEVLDCLTKEVCANDVFEPPSTPVALPHHHLPGAFKPRGRVIGYYAAAQVKGGNWRTIMMSVAEVESHAKRYGGEKLGPAWNKGDRPNLDEGLCSFDKMALKTCLRMLCNGRDVPLTADITQALTLEEVASTAPLASEYQGYTREGTRPALTMGTGTTVEDLLQDLSGASDKEAIAVTIELETRGKDIPKEATSEETTTTQEPRTTQKKSTSTQKRGLQNSDDSITLKNTDQPLREGMAWDTLRTYQGDARLPEGILESIDSALTAMIPPSETEAFTLAGAVSDWINKTHEAD
jgi:phage RecT family recombinase